VQPVLVVVLVVMLMMMLVVMLMTTAFTLMFVMMFVYHLLSVLLFLGAKLRNLFCNLVANKEQGLSCRRFSAEKFGSYKLIA
jgi:hypothetical protein